MTVIRSNGELSSLTKSDDVSPRRRTDRLAISARLRVNKGEFSHNATMNLKALR